MKKLYDRVQKYEQLCAELQAKRESAAPLERDLLDALATLAKAAGEMSAELVALVKSQETEMPKSGRPVLRVVESDDLRKRDESTD